MATAQQALFTLGITMRVTGDNGRVSQTLRARRNRAFR